MSSLHSLNKVQDRMHLDLCCALSVYAQSLEEPVLRKTHLLDLMVFACVLIKIA
jgi:hypothetical protein